MYFMAEYGCRGINKNATNIKYIHKFSRCSHFTGIRYQHFSSTLFFSALLFIMRAKRKTSMWINICEIIKKNYLCIIHLCVCFVFVLSAHKFRHFHFTNSISGELENYQSRHYTHLNIIWWEISIVSWQFYCECLMNFNARFHLNGFFLCFWLPSHCCSANN